MLDSTRIAYSPSARLAPPSLSMPIWPIYARECGGTRRGSCKPRRGRFEAFEGHLAGVGEGPRHGGFVAHRPGDHRHAKPFLHEAGEAVRDLVHAEGDE